MLTMKMQRTSISLMLVASLLFGLVVVPATTVNAGILSNFMSSTRPLLVLAGKVGGAIAGASLCGAFCPPLGMLAGGVLGWIAGGIITGYATGSLANLATVGGAAAGAMALGPGIMGVVGGALLGGALGRMAMNLLYKVDSKMTGGVLFAKTSAIVSKWTGSANRGTFSNNATMAPMPSGSSSMAGIAMDRGGSTTSFNSLLTAAQQKYQAAYNSYTVAAQKGDQQQTAASLKAYQEAYQEYQTLATQGK